ncbi:MAG: radical SAM protein [Candidatus Nanoarchaeia archaeon]|nr:radical SAM protein [Candidatus Nanoarchaeia archaeon]
MLKIGLIDVDGHKFPNLPLMKISTYHRKLGHDVKFANSFEYYDKVYMTKVFTFTQDYTTIINSKEIIKGGTGYNLDIRLPDEIECQYPDYSLYNIKNVAYGYLTRGCPRNCDFCIVGEKEGLKSYKVANLDKFWKGQKEIKLLDPNLLGCNDHLELLDQLIKSKAYVDFTQGLDCRLLTIKNIEKINQLKIKMLHFAWDKEMDENLIIKNLELFNKYTLLDMRRKRVYVLTNFDTTFDYDLYRVETLKKLNYDPYIMIYNKDSADIKYKKLQRYINSKFIYLSKQINSFEEYTNCIKNIKNKNIENQIKIEI